jgi:hypothetical protein
MADAIRDVNQSLKPLRPPTAPDSDILKEQDKIHNILARNLLVIQIALFTIFLAFLNYLLVPIKYAHYVAFLTLSVGIAVGIFLFK